MKTTSNESAVPAAKIFKPSSKFIRGTNIYTNVEKWTVVGDRVYVKYTDGRECRSIETIGSLCTGGFALASKE